jgi:hypothetical protein
VAPATREAASRAAAGSQNLEAVRWLNLAAEHFAALQIDQATAVDLAEGARRCLDPSGADSLSVELLRREEMCEAVAEPRFAEGLGRRSRNVAT